MEKPVQAEDFLLVDWAYWSKGLSFSLGGLGFRVRV